MNVDAIVAHANTLSSEAAIELLERTASGSEVPPERLAPVYLALASRLWKAREPVRACRWMELRVAVLSEGDEPAWLYRGFAEMLAEAGQPDRARAYAHEALRLMRIKGEYLAAYLQDLSSTLWKCGDRKLAMTLALEWLEIEVKAEEKPSVFAKHRFLGPIAARIQIAEWCEQLGDVEAARGQYEVVAKCDRQDLSSLGDQGLARLANSKQGPT